MFEKTSKPYRIGFLLVDGFALMSYTSTVEPLRAANVLYAKQTQLYDWVHIPAVGAEAYSSAGVAITGDHQVGDALSIDLLLIIAGGDPFAFKNKTTFAWLRKLAASGLTIGGVSGGPVIMVNAGLMDGRRMTVHWEHANSLMEIAPNVALSKTLYVMDRNRLTCAGGVAPLDFMHAMITDHHGADFARKVSDWFLHTDIRPPGGAQRASIIDKYGVNHRVLVQAIEIMENHIGDPLKLSEIETLVNCTQRHLNRLFHDSLNTTAMTFYRNLRLDHAKNLLTQTSLSLTEIAYEVGFSSSAHFSYAFRSRFRISPKEIR